MTFLENCANLPLWLACVGVVSDLSSVNAFYTFWLSQLGLIWILERKKKKQEVKQSSELVRNLSSVEENSEDLWYLPIQDLQTTRDSP